MALFDVGHRLDTRRSKVIFCNSFVTSGRIQQVVGGEHLAHEAGRQGLLGSEDAAGRHPLHRLADAHHPGQEPA